METSLNSLNIESLLQHISKDSTGKPSCENTMTDCALHLLRKEIKWSPNKGLAKLYKSRWCNICLEDYDKEM